MSNKKHHCHQRIIQIKEPKVMPCPLRDKGGEFFDIEGLVLAHSEEYLGNVYVSS